MRLQSHLQRPKDFVVIFMREKLPRSVCRDVKPGHDLTAGQELGGAPHSNAAMLIAPKSVHIRNVYCWDLHGTRGVCTAASGTVLGLDMPACTSDSSSSLNVTTADPKNSPEQRNIL